MRIHSESVESSGIWWQAVSCKPKTFYRVEVTVTCELVPPTDLHDPQGAGFVLCVEACEGPPAARRDSDSETSRTTPGLHRTMDPTAVRTYYRVPDGIRRLRIGVGLVNASGTASIRQVRFIETLEPEETSHILAIPPPNHAQPAPRVAGRVCVCSETAGDRAVTRLLQIAYGHSCVRAIRPRELHAVGETIDADALLLPDERPPSAVRSFSRLVRLAERHIVVISLPAFAELVGDSLSLRRVEQEDDPIGAIITFGNYATRGFALHDVIPYAWPGKVPGSFVQNHFRKTAKLKRFCERHGFVSLLESVCDQDVTSYRPVCLYKETPGGGLFVLDIDPVEAPASTFAEPALAMHLLLSVLGRTQCNLGQYVVPERTESDFRALIRDMPDRFESLALREPDVPIEEATEQVVTVGGEDRSFGLPLSKRPLIVIRSGLVPGDVESVYGAFVWLKQLVRMQPYPSPYVRRLVSRFRLVWLPCVAPWKARDGWRRGDGDNVAAPLPRQPGRRGVDSDEENGPGRCAIHPDDEISLLIDLVSVPRNTARVLLSGSDHSRHTSAYSHLLTWLPQLEAVLPSGRYFLPTVAEDEHFCDRSRISWRFVGYDARVVVAPDRFDGPLFQRVLAGGGNVVRIEVPGCDADFAAHSIQRTDLAATLLERVVGLHYGLIAVNRTRERVQLDRFPPLEPGEGLVLDRNDVLLRSAASQAG